MSVCLQSAQRSKARKLRHIMQLEEEVQTLQGISSQQQATIGGLQQEAALLSAPHFPLAFNSSLTLTGSPRDAYAGLKCSRGSSEHTLLGLAPGVVHARKEYRLLWILEGSC